MTEEHSTDDDRLDVRLRSGLAALVAEAPEPPPLPSRSAAGSWSGNRRSLAVAATVLVIMVAAAAVVASRRDDRGQQVSVGTPSTLPVASELVGTRWVLAHAQEGSQPVAGGRMPRLSFSRCTDSDCSSPYRISGTDGCNGWGAEADFVEGGFRLHGFAMTSMACEDDLSPLVGRVWSHDGLVPCERHGDTLRVNVGTVELEYVRTSVQLPAPTGAVVAEGQHDGDLWQLTSRREGEMSRLELTVRGSQPTVDRSGGVGTSVGSTDTSDSMQGVKLGSGQVAYGFAPARAARVTAEVADGTAVELDLHEVVDSEGLQAFVGFTAPGEVTIRMYDASGAVLQEQRLPSDG
jgi:heat shock protein HslJ